MFALSARSRHRRPWLHSANDPTAMSIDNQGRVYLTNSGYNRVEVFDIRRQRFVEPIETGQLPHAMAMSLDANTLYFYYDSPHAPDTGVYTDDLNTYSLDR